MANKLEVSIEIIAHATEDIRKILESFEELFEIQEKEFSKTNLTGHFENPITMLNVKISKKKAENFISKLISNLSMGEIDEIINDLENRIQNSTLYLRLGKQELIEGALTLREKDSIKVKIFTPIYNKKDTLKSYTKLLKVSS